MKKKEEKNPYEDLDRAVRTAVDLLLMQSDDTHRGAAEALKQAVEAIRRG